MFSLSPHSFLNDNDYAPSTPPPSAVTFQMPDVVVYPPEEEQYHTPPYLCFNSAEPYANDEEEDTFDCPEMNNLQSRLDMWQHAIGSDAPIFHRGYVGIADVPMPRRSSFHHNRPTAALDIFNEAFNTSRRHKEDEDVIEVVKVPRGDTMHDVRTLKKGGKSFKARATLALRTIRGGKRAPPRQPVPPAKENAFFDADMERERETEHEDGTAGLRRSKTTKSVRRLSKPLSQFFGKSAPLDVPESVSPTTELYSTLPSTASNTRPSVETRNSFGAASSYTLNAYNDEPARSSSPSPSSRGTRRRFSFVNLQSLFTAPTTGATSSPSTTSDSLPSTVEPTTPVDNDDFPRRFSLGRGSGESDGLDVAMEDQIRKSGSMDSATEAAQDISFEMRLDSLHFDSLSFDVEGFDISR
ncbi:hypothetical protein OF83DRAFT_1169875 [Amylostereum chailletii]|nr:hypothetical protein OF83DRAFT_1169875 [Amylostereum chailletii]